MVFVAFFLFAFSSVFAQNISTIAGNGTGGYTSDGIPAITSEVHNPTTVAVDAAGNVYIADYANARVRMVNTSGIISTVAGTGVAGYNFDGIQATAAKLNQPNGVALDAAGNIYIAEMAGYRIRKINTSGIISTIAGNGTAGTTGDGGPASAALVNHPTNLTVDGAGNIYIADWGNSKIRKISSTGIMSTLAGTGIGGYTGDGIATAQKLNAPYSVSLDALDNLYISDENNHILRKLNLSTGIISTIAGVATSPGFSGDGFPATSAQFNHPDGIVANAGQLYIADFTNNRIRKVDLSTGIVTTAVGNGAAGFGGDGGPATSALVQINGPAGVMLDPVGNVYIADFTNNRIRKVSMNNHAPYFDSGHVQTLHVCDGAGLSITSYLAITDSDVSQTETWTLYNNAVNGHLYNGASLLSTGTVATGTSTGGILSIPGTFNYVHTPGMPLIDSFVFRVNDGISIDSEKFYITINPLPLADVIAGPSSVCVGSTITLTNDSLGGTWISKNTGVATITSGGVVTGITGGATDSILYVVSNACGNDTVYKVITVNLTPGPISPSGAVSLCIGDFIDLSDIVPGGTWSASNTNATVSTIGHVVGITAGVDTITYAIGTCSVTKTVTVNGPAAILPRSPVVCQSNTISLTDATGGGSWSSGSPSIATVSGSGLVTGVAPGTAVISYTVAGCSNLDTVTVISGPASIGPSSGTVCVGNTLTFTDATGGGTWSMSNTHASISGGVVTGVTAGVDTVIYTVGTCFVTAVVTINTAPAAITPPGPVSVCIGSTTTLVDATPLGTWSSGSVGIATVNSGGVVTGVANGSAVISYTVGGCSALKTVSVNGPAAITPHNPTICSGGITVSLSDATSGGTWTSSLISVATVTSGGLVTSVGAGTAIISYTVAGCSAFDTITVIASPAAITPPGPTIICTGSTSLLADVTPAGTWSSSAIGVATVSAGGLVTAIAAGTATISYTIGSCYAVKTVTVNGPAAISPYDPTICSGGATVALSDATSGGTWSSGAPGIATVSAGGLVTSVGVGIAPISYTIGACSAVDTVTVISGPAAITPPGPVTICTGSTSLLADATSGGAWSSNNAAVATVSAGGLVTGVTVGIATISYVIGSCYSVKDVTVSVAPAALSPSSANVCVGNTTTFTESVSGGTWSSSAPSIATVAGGVVTGVAPGISTISYTIGTCIVSATVTVSATSGPGTITGPTSVCVGSSITLLDATPGGTWSSATPAIATVSGSGVVTGVSGGIATISYTIINACGSVGTFATVNVVPAGVAAISGPSSVCAGTFATLTDATTGGTWSASNATATISGAGLLTGITPGIDTITYTVVNVCGTTSATKIITVGLFLSAATISGPGVVCVGLNITLTDPAPGGVWSSSNAHATVVGGLVSGVSAGVDTISYTVTSSCGSAVATHTVTVNPLPVAGTITGPSSICIGSFITYTESATGGTWSMSNAHATIAGSGIVSPVSVGTDTIIYTVTNPCGTVTATKVITIGAFLSAGTITGPGTVCIGSPVTMTDATPGGVWSASNTTATVSGSGLVTGIVPGIDTISYTVSGSCGTAVATKVVTINAVPVAGTIVGPSSICMGTPVTFTDAATGGVWSMSNAHATISGVGLVTPVSAGTDTIIYTVTNACGTAVATKVITIGAFLSAGTISGPATVCAGSTITLTETAPGGSWSSANAHAAISGVGVVTGLSGGVDTMFYIVSGSCGSVAASYVVTVNPLPVAGSITGAATMCTGTYLLFTDPAPGGVWSSSNASATVSVGGMVSALLPGVDTISYTVTNVCGTAVATQILTINLSPDAGTITGPSLVCVGANITLTDPASGGTWSSSNANATISGTGVVTGVTSGMDTISYTVSGSCGAAVATYIIGIGASATAGTITGPGAVCMSALITLSDAVPGGSWSSSNANATVTGSGVVTGILPGVDTISYTVTGVCGVGSATYVITVNVLPVAGSISGPSNVCVGAVITLTDGTPGGVWSASNPNATVSSLGVVTGVIAGTDDINYTVTNSCGSAIATQTVTVNGLPYPGTITGAGTVCVGATITLSDAIPGGTWSASNANATISGGGIVTGVTTGTDTLSYTLTNGCGTSSATAVVNVITSGAGPILGSSSVCVGSGITLSVGVPGGTWTASNAHALLVGPGIVDGITAGVDTIFYTVTGVCGLGTSVKIVTVNPVPVVAPISGPTHQCTGTLITLTDATTGGIWSSSNPSVASVGSVSGIATGVAVGVATITYTYANVFGCPTSVTTLDTVSLITSIPAITGPASLCPGTSVTLTDALAGGSWSSSAPAIATVGAGTGIVTGVAAGSVDITYMVVSTCGTSFVTQTEVVNPLPVVAAITGTASECPGTTSALSDATPGGIWSSSDVLIATVGATTGIVTGITSGTVTVNYTVTNSFGCSFAATITNTVNTAPVVAAITGVTNECIGSTSLLSDATAGGTWSSSNPSVAGVGAGTGIVTGVAAGVVTITYTVPGTGCAGIAVIANTVNSVPVSMPITGITNVCLGSTTTLSDASFGGVWSSSNTAVATINTTGVVSGVAAGSAEIYYAVSNSCGSMTDSVAVSVQVALVAGTISGPSVVCQGATITLTDAATGGIWSSSNARATVSAGVVTGISGGMDTIKYTVSNACGSAVATKPISVIALPYPGVISGFTSVCEGNSIALTETVTGGLWSSSNTSVATVSAGLVAGVAAGSTTISYSVSNSCGSRSATHAVTVVPASLCGTSVSSTASNTSDIAIYPNPAVNVLIIDAPVKVNVQILSVDGKVQIAQNGITSIDVSQLADGVYMVLIYDETGGLLKTSRFAKLK